MMVKANQMELNLAFWSKKRAFSGTAQVEGSLNDMWALVNFLIYFVLSNAFRLNHFEYLSNNSTFASSYVSNLFQTNNRKQKIKCSL